MNYYTFLKHVDTSHMVIASVLAESAQNLPLLAMCPKYSILYCAKKYFLHFTYNIYSRRQEKIVHKCSSYFYSEFLYTEISSRYTKINSLSKSWRILFIKH